MRGGRATHAPSQRCRVRYVTRCSMETTRADFKEVHALIDGTKVTLRHVRPDDAGELKRGFARLSPSSRYRRFFGGVTELSDDLLRYLTCVDGHDHVAIGAVTQIEDSPAETGLGIARFIRCQDDPTVAEVAVTVLDDWQGKGLGRLLGLTIGRAAYERGIRRFRGESLADNEPVRQMLEEVGAIVRKQEDGRLVFEVEFATAENHVTPNRFELAVRRLLRAAASQLGGLIRSSTPPPSR
jgi:GNAT superfamily N-acetyltransferase